MLTAGIRFTRGEVTAPSLIVDFLEEIFAILHILRCPELP
jgi:hypothetical protein